MFPGLSLFFQMPVIKPEFAGEAEAGSVRCNNCQFLKGDGIVKFKGLNNFRLVRDFEGPDLFPLAVVLLIVKAELAVGLAIINIHDLIMQGKFFAVLNLFIKHPGTADRAGYTGGGGFIITGQIVIVSLHIAGGSSAKLTALGAVIGSWQPFMRQCLTLRFQTTAASGCLRTGGR